MSKKHFIAFAKHIAALNAEKRFISANACYEMIVKCNDNPAFDKTRFRHACQFLGDKKTD